MRVNLSGIGRGQTIVDQRPVAQNEATWSDDPWPRIEVVLGGDVNAAAEMFVKTIDQLN